MNVPGMGLGKSLGTVKGYEAEVLTQEFLNNKQEQTYRIQSFLDFIEYLKNGLSYLWNQELRLNHVQFDIYVNC